jgi:hypothetical protein
MQNQPLVDITLSLDKIKLVEGSTLVSKRGMQINTPKINSYGAFSPI